jgi:acyl CoA:acetate/3-ketoacid CoA transferase beta subunit
MSSEAKATPADQMVVTMAAEIGDGDLATQGLGTHLPTCAYFLAKRTHAPSCCVLYSTGGTFSQRIGPIGLSSIPRNAVEGPLRRASYSEIVCDTLVGMAFKEFARPAQVDGAGRTNNVLIGARSNPKLRLPGAGGIPDFSPYSSHHSMLYLPRHERRALVSELDFVSGLGARLLVTNLCVIAFGPEGAALRSVHAGVTVEEVLAETGFELAVPAKVEVTPLPTDRQLDLIREIDPHGMRDLEFVSARERVERVREVYALESERSAVG